MKKSKIIIIAVIAVVLAAVLGALAVFQGEARTLLSVKEKSETGIYEINYAANYKLDELLEAVRITGTEPDEKGRVYSTQWSSIYDLTNPSLTLCSDMDYDTPYIYEVK